MSCAILFTAPGCARCKITRQFLLDQGIEFEELDFKGNGKNRFAKFYRTNRIRIYRDADGVEFPVFTNGDVIRQGVSMIIAYIHARDRIDGFIKRNRLHGKWLNGIDVSGGDPNEADDLYTVLKFIKKFGLMIEAISNGRNAAVLEAVLQQGLIDRIILNIYGPLDLWTDRLGNDACSEDLIRSLTIAPRFPEYRFITHLTPFIVPGSDPEAVRFLTPDEIQKTTKMIETATKSKKHPYVLIPWSPDEETDDRFKSLTHLDKREMFKYRSAARRYMVMTEIEK